MILSSVSAYQGSALIHSLYDSSKVVSWDDVYAGRKRSEETLTIDERTSLSVIELDPTGGIQGRIVDKVVRNWSENSQKVVDLGFDVYDPSSGIAEGVVNTYKSGFFADHHFAVCGKRDQGIQGIMLWGDDPLKPKTTLFLYELMTNPANIQSPICDLALRVKHVGEVCIQHLRSCCVQTGRNTIRLTSTKGAVPFYTHCGFQPFDPEDDLTEYGGPMIWTLGGAK